MYTCERTAGGIEEEGVGHNDSEGKGAGDIASEGDADIEEEGSGDSEGAGGSEGAADIAGEGAGEGDGDNEGAGDSEGERADEHEGEGHANAVEKEDGESVTSAGQTSSRGTPSRVTSFWERNDNIREENEFRVKMVRLGVMNKTRLTPVEPEDPPPKCNKCGLYAFGVCPKCSDIMCTLCARGWICSPCTAGGLHPATHAGATSSSSR